MQTSETLYGTDRVMADVLRERKRQVVVEGFGRCSDDQQDAGRLALAAAAYALSWANCKQIERESGEAVATEALAEAGPHDFWPMDPRWWKPHNDRHDLVRAAALLVAEIERLDRLSATLYVHPTKEQAEAFSDPPRSFNAVLIETGGAAPPVVADSGIAGDEREPKVAQPLPPGMSATCADNGPVSSPTVESSPVDCPADSGTCGGGE